MGFKKALGLSIGGALVAALLVAAVISVSHPPAASTESENTSQLRKISRAYSMPQKPADELPGSLSGSLTPSDIDETTSRYAGESGNTKFWIASNKKGEVCLILMRDDEDGAYNCLPPGLILYAGATSVQLQDTASGGQGTRAYLLPEGYKAHERWKDHQGQKPETVPQPLGKSGVSSQVLVTTPGEAPERLDITTATGDEVQFAQ